MKIDLNLLIALVTVLAHKLPSIMKAFKDPAFAKTMTLDDLVVKPVNQYYQERGFSQADIDRILKE